MTGQKKSRFKTPLKKSSQIQKTIRQKILEKNIESKGNQFIKKLKDSFKKEKALSKNKILHDAIENIEKKLIHENTNPNINKTKLKKVNAHLEQIPDLKKLYPKIYLLLMNIILTNKNLHLKIEKERGTIQEPIKDFKPFKHSEINPYHKNNAQWFKYEIDKIRHKYNVKDHCVLKKHGIIR